MAPLTWVRLVTRSALQSRKWQLIGMSQWCRSTLCGHPLPALTDNWTHEVMFYQSSLCVSVCVSVSATRTTAKVISQFETWLWLGRGLPLNFWWLSGPGCGSLFDLPHHCRIGQFRRFISISYTITDRFSWNKAVHPLHIGSSLVTTQI